MDMIVNNLPSKTWNFLKMNHSSLKVEEALASFVPEIQNENKMVSVSVFQTEAKEIYEMNTGMGEDMTALTKEAEAVEIVAMENSKEETPVVLSYDYKNAENAVSRLFLHAKKNALLRVVLEFSSEEEQGISALQTRIYGEEGSEVELYVSNILGKEVLYLNDIGGKTEKDAEIHLLKLELGGKSLYAGTEITLDGNGSSFTSKVGYHTKGYQLLDMNYNAVHYGKKTETEMEVMGSLEDGAEKIFRGTIDFKKGSSGAVGAERENVLMLGEDTVNRSIPLILCSEEDVEGNHGASIGQLDEKVLFYLSSRGFSEEAAKLLIASSRIKAICDLIPSEKVRARAEEFETEQN